MQGEILLKNSRKIKKVLYSIILCFLFLTTGIVKLQIAAIAAEAGSDNCTYLESIGFPEDILHDMSEEMQQRITEQIAGKSISAARYSDERIGSVVVKKIEISLLADDSADVTGKTICIFWEYDDNKPLMKENDFISVNWNSTAFLYDADSFYAEDCYKKGITDTWSVNETHNVLATAGQERIGYWSKLKPMSKKVGGCFTFTLLSTEKRGNSAFNSDGLRFSLSHRCELTKTIAFILIILAAIICTVIVMTRKKHKV